MTTNPSKLSKNIEDSVSQASSQAPVTSTETTSNSSPLSKNAISGESTNPRLKVSTQNSVGNIPPSPFTNPSESQSNSFNSKVTRAASISVVPQGNIDFLNNGFSSSLGTSPITRIHRPNPLSGSLGGWSNQKDIWSADYTSPIDVSRSPSLPKDPDSPFTRNYLGSLHDSFLSPRRSSFNPSETVAAGFGRSRTSTGTEYVSRARNLVSSLKDDTLSSDYRLSSSMSPMFGAPVDRSPLYRDFLGSPQLSGSLNQEYENEAPFALNPNDYYRVSLARRMSLTPNFGPYNPYDDLSSQMETLTLEEYAHILNRRHSVAASAFPARKATQADQSETTRLEVLEEDQDDQSEQFALEMGTDDPPKEEFSSPKKDTYYVVEFKGSRNDLFYPAPECSSSFKTGDYVVVEGDRGKDMGTVIRTDITIEEYKAQFNQITAGPDGSQAIKEIEPKKIFRGALPHEVSSLTTKAQDEEKALMLVRAKAIQREIYMQIVDAEYQWDRRKLTFYFIADRRIDFRDLVRELFKIYKTRIWMCAVAPPSGN